MAGRKKAASSRARIASPSVRDIAATMPVRSDSAGREDDSIPDNPSPSPIINREARLRSR